VCVCVVSDKESYGLFAQSNGWKVICLAEKRHLVCPLCQGTDFEKQEGKMDSKWGFTAHKIVMMVCRNCQFIMSFSKGRTIFDFD